MNPKDLKPWQIVLAQIDDPLQHRGNRLFVGELVSFPTPEGTIMVRTVPGLAATAIEVPVSAILKKERIKKVCYYEVTLLPDALSTNFPVDMLRYDNAVPANFKINNNFQVELEEGHIGPIVASCLLWGHSHCITPARWASFGWTVKHHSDAFLLPERTQA